MKPAIILLFPLFLFNVATAQTKDIRVEVFQSVANQAKLYQYVMGIAVPVDSVRPESPGIFRFTNMNAYPKGLYKVSVGQNIQFNVVVSGEPYIDVNTLVYAPEDSLWSDNSFGNKLYWEYQQIKRVHGQKAWLIQSLSDFYPDTILFHQLLRQELIRLNDELNEHSKYIWENNKDLLAAQLIMVEQTPIQQPFPESWSERERIVDTWWDNIYLSDVAILNSPGFINRLWLYFELLFDNDFDKEEQDQVLMEGIVNMLMNVDISTRGNLRDIIAEGFNDTDYQEVADFTNSLSLVDLKPTYNDALTASRSRNEPQVRVGEKAFDFVVETKDGKRVKLSKLNAEYKLLIFWSSWCPHCLEALPELLSVYSQYKPDGLEVISISIDEEDEPWLTYVSRLNLNWINVRIPISRDNRLFIKYNVNETPKIFLLDNDLTILSRPTTRRQLQAKLRKLVRTSS